MCAGKIVQFMSVSVVNTVVSLLRVYIDCGA
jgi:hypothetical protein